MYRAISQGRKEERIPADDEDEQPRRIPNSFGTKDSHTSTDIVTRQHQSPSGLMLTESNRPVATTAGQATPSKDRGLAMKESFQRQNKGRARGEQEQPQRGHHPTESLPIITRFEPPQQRPDSTRAMGRELIRQRHRSALLTSLVDDVAVVSSRQQRRQQSGHTLAPDMPPSSSTTVIFGNSDDSRYWDYAFRFVHRGDLGHRCRECRGAFLKLNEKLAVRRGGRIELKYHESCFSMIADPRSQPTSSANVGKFVGELKGTRAPEELYRKMRTRGHW